MKGKKGKRHDRHNPYNQERCVNLILARISTSEMSLQKICHKSYLPSAPTFLLWISAAKSLAERYAYARKLQADLIANKILEISDNTNENALHNKNRIEARKWLASKLDPHNYGDRLEISGNVTVNNEATSLQAALALSHILERLQARSTGQIEPIPIHQDRKQLEH